MDRNSIAHMSLPAALRHVDDCSHGYTRVRQRGKLVILDEDGKLCKDEEVLARVQRMVIPPQWEQVWICADEHGHIQCTGRDQRGRKQYIYHEAYVAHRQQAKFDKIIRFAERLPQLREHVEQLLKRPTWDHDKMLGLVIRLLDRTHLRIGSARYEAENETYGLTTLRRKHLHAKGRALELAFQGKSGKFRQVTIKNRQLKKMVTQVAELPGYQLFRYKDEQGRVQRMDSGEVNRFLHEVMGDEYSAKDFRTWGGTSLAVKYFHQAKMKFDQGGQRGKLSTKLVKLVAKELGNTVSVCREYYIHPRILELADRGTLPDHDWADVNPSTADLAPFEEHTLELLLQH